MTDLWDEKPKSVEVAEEYADDYYYYHASEMDAWLEKLKLQYKIYKKGCEVVEGYEAYIMSGERYKELEEKAEKWDRRATAECLCDELHNANEKLEAVKPILYDVCDYYGTETCREGVCDCDPKGWEGCLTRKILEILEDPGSD